jgi:hypothetical protein
MANLSLDIGRKNSVPLRDIFPSGFDVPRLTSARLFEPVCQAIYVPLVPTTLHTLKERVVKLEETCKELQKEKGLGRLGAFLKTILVLSSLALGILGVTMLTGGAALALAAPAFLSFCLLNCCYSKDQINQWSPGIFVVAQILGPFVPIWESCDKEKALSDSIKGEKSGLEASIQQFINYYRNHEEELSQGVNQELVEKEAMRRAPIGIELVDNHVRERVAELESGKEELELVRRWLDLPR